MGNRFTYYNRVCQSCNQPFISKNHKHQMYCGVPCKIKGARPKQIANAKNQYGYGKPDFSPLVKQKYRYRKVVTDWVILPDGSMSRQTYHEAECTHGY